MLRREVPRAWERLKIYTTEYSPYERHIKKGTNQERLVKLICQNEEELGSTLTGKQKETFEKFKDCQSEPSSVTEQPLQPGLSLSFV